MAMRSKGDADTAIGHFNLVLKQHPDDPEVLYQLGQTLRQKGDLEGAIRVFETALKHNPEIREAYYGLGLALKQSAASSRSKRDAIARRPGPEAEQLFRQASEAAARGDFAGARAALQRALEFDREYSEAYNLL